MKEWHFRWFCDECGYCFGKGQESKHLMFGFCKPCPKCGYEVGSNIGNGGLRKKVRYERVFNNFKLFNVKTWIPKLKMVEYRR